MAAENKVISKLKDLDTRVEAIEGTPGSTTFKALTDTQDYENQSNRVLKVNEDGTLINYGNEFYNSDPEDAANKIVSTDGAGKIPSNLLPVTSQFTSWQYGYGTTFALITDLVDALPGDIASKVELIADAAVPTITGTFKLILDGDPTIEDDWLKVSEISPVSSVNSKTGVIELGAIDIPYNDTTGLIGSTNTQGAITNLLGRVDGKKFIDASDTPNEYKLEDHGKFVIVKYDQNNPSNSQLEFVERVLPNPSEGGYTHYLGWKRSSKTKYTKIAEVRPTAGNTAYLGFTLFGGLDYGFGDLYSEITGQIGSRNNTKFGTVYQVGRPDDKTTPRIGIILRGNLKDFDIYVEIRNDYPTYMTFTTKGAPATNGGTPVINWMNESTNTEPSGIQWYDTIPKGVSEGLILSDPTNESKSRTNQSEVNKDIKTAIWSSAVQVGNLSSATGNTSISIGESSEATADSATVVGRQAKGYGYRSTAISRLASTVAGADYATVVGHSSTGGAPRVVNVGVDTVTQGASGISIGDTTVVSGAGGIRIGQLGTASSNAIGIGREVTASGGNSTAVGDRSEATQQFSTAIGAGAKSLNASEIRLGASTLSILSSYKPLTQISDIRDKTDIQDIDNSKALEFINKLEPITYKQNNRESYVAEPTEIEVEKIIEVKDKDGKIEKVKTMVKKMKRVPVTDFDKESHTKGTKKGSRGRVGLKAQQVQEALIETFESDNYADIVNDNFKDGEIKDANHQLTVSYTNIIPMLIGSIKELKKEIEELKKNK